ncbi:MAG: protein phosphatase 2C domain-containing protein [Gemmataceae bacterium]
MTSNLSADTKPDLRDLPPGAAASPLLGVEVGGRTHPGLVRPNNEDNFHVVRFGRYLRTVLSSLPAGEVPEDDAPPGHGFAVADGMGGHAAGEVASRVALAALVEVAFQTPDWILGRDDDLLERVMERTARRFQQVSTAVREQAQSQPGLLDMGTTLALALSLSDALVVAHVGDSRVYLFRDGRLHPLTRDHTFGQLLAERDPVAAARLRHVLTRCIGVTGTGCEPDIAHYRLADGDRLLLCTDGLTDMVDDALIARELGRGTSSDEVCRALVDLALGGGGRDNVTAVVATYRRSETPATPSPPPST